MSTIKPVLITSIREIDILTPKYGPYFLISPGAPFLDTDEITMMDVPTDENTIDRFGVISENIGMANVCDQLAMAIRNKLHLPEYWFMYSDSKSLYDIGITYYNHNSSLCWVTGSIVLKNLIRTIIPKFVYIPDFKEDIKFDIPPYPRSVLYRPLIGLSKSLGFTLVTYPLGMFNHKPVKVDIIDPNWDKIPSILRDYRISTRYILNKINNMAHKTIAVEVRHKIGDLVTLKSPEINSKLLIERMIVDDMYNTRIP
jgi:hypothetical protein